MKRDARHRAAIDEVLAHLNSYPDSPYVLKGGGRPSWSAAAWTANRKT